MYIFLELLEHSSLQVRGTSKEDHYEMREYSLDVIENEDDLSIAMKGRLFPIYPSKGGLKPHFFRDIMIRFIAIIVSLLFLMKFSSETIILFRMKFKFL